MAVSMIKYDPEFKKAVIDFAMNRGGAEASRFFHVPVSTVYSWVKKEKEERDVRHDLMIAKKYADKKKSAQYPFDLTIEEFKRLFDKGVCGYTGEPLVDPSVERINPFLGYIPRNVILVNGKANSIKSSLDAFVKNKSIQKDVKIKLLKVMIKALEKGHDEGKLIGTKKEEAQKSNVFGWPVTLTKFAKEFKTRTEQWPEDSVSRLLHILIVLTSGKCCDMNFKEQPVAEILLPLIPTHLRKTFRKHILDNRRKILKKEY